MPLQTGDIVVVNTDHGPDLAKVTTPSAQGQDLTKPLINVIRHAQPEDLEKARQDRQREALAKCKEMVTRLGLKMKALSASYDIEGGRLTIFFSAQERVDFRSLVRKLSRTLKTRVELRQVGPRDEAKLVGGIGKCGYPLCCQSFLTGFTPVSIKMAKQQGLALNPMKISGICGRLLCCLSYESKQYAATKEKMPQAGQEVATPSDHGQGNQHQPAERNDSSEANERPLNQASHQ
jgi:cell fate regulator YaaT (PSP1 superfamily)